MEELRPKIALAEWSLHRSLFEWAPRHLDLARLAHETFGLEGVEYGSSFFREKATDFGYLAEMKKRAEDAGVKSLLVKVEGEGPLGSAEPSDRGEAIGSHFPWIAAAAFLGCDSISVGAEGSGSGAPYLDWMADSLRRLAAIAEPYGIGVLVGNRVGLASDGSWMSALMKKTAHPRVGTHPHFDNFDLGGGELYPRYLGVDEMMPWARALSARSYDFDGEGRETRIDFDRMARIALASKYSGWVGIEYDGRSLSESVGIARTIALVRRAWSKALETAEADGAK
jgi:sugar phosphate isomerase/epimerase